jgi:hypothetical protein
VGKIIPIHTEEMPLKERIKRMEDRGQIEPVTYEDQVKIPPPIPVPDGIAQHLLQEEREDG